MPTRYYNQLNGKTAQENYKNYKNKIKSNNDNFFFDIIKNMLSSVMETALNEILKDFEK